MNSFLKKFIGTKEFYGRVFVVVFPIIIQTFLTNFVSFLDNIMVGRLGELPMSGVSIVNQLIFVFNLCVFGGLAGAGLFGSQFWGKRDMNGLRYVFRMKAIIGIFICIVGFSVLFLFDDSLIGLYLTGETNTPEENLQTLEYALDYLSVAIWGLVPFCAVQAYAGSLRETEETKVPMVAGLVAVVVNFVFNLLLIFGLCGFPALGVKGAAIATVISRFVELFIILFWTYRHTDRFPYFKKALRSLRVPKDLFTDVIKRDAPLLLNEFLWSLGMAILLKFYSERGIMVVAAMNINNTAIDLFNVSFFSMGSAIAILVGKRLGANEIEEAKDEDRKLIALGVLIAIVVMGIAMAVSGLFPMLYRTDSPLVRPMARDFIMISAAFMPMHALLHTAYFTIRCGGKTWITFFFDSGYTWAVMIPTAILLTRFTDIPIRPLYALVLATEGVKVIVGIIMIKKGIWINNIIDDKRTDGE